MNAKLILTTVALVWAATPISTASADCADPYDCICPWEDVVAVGTVDDFREMTDSNGFPLTMGTFTVERIKGRDGADTVLEIGHTADMFIPGDLAPGARVIATAPQLTDIEVNHQRTVESDGITCSGETFTEDDAFNLALTAECRTEAGERGISNDCDDTSTFGCSVSDPNRPAPHAGWLLGLALAVAASRRSCWRR